MLFELIMWEKFAKKKKKPRQLNSFSISRFADLICNFLRNHKRWWDWFSFSTNGYHRLLSVPLDSYLTRISRSQVFIRMKCFEKFRRIHRQMFMLEPPFNVVGHTARPVNIAKLSRTAFLQNTSGKLLLDL